jgi:hypothetical protein
LNFSKKDVSLKLLNKQNMLGFKGKYGFSFSLSRLLGVSSLKNSIARKTGIPTTKGGMERKIGRKVLNLLFKK